MIVDSYRFLPRSFRAGYELAPTNEPQVWTPFEPRLADATIALLTSAGLYIDGEQPPFDLDRERAEPTWGDPTHRVIPREHSPLAMAHLHVNNADVLADNEIALPLRTLDTLVADGVVGASSASHYSVMGFQGNLDTWRAETAPAIVEHCRAEHTDGIVLAPV
jgi:D-proline reductase (dithiol) PrdB